MRKIKTVVACVTIAGLAGIIAPSAAQADNASETSATGLETGLLMAYGAPYRNYGDEGTFCEWSGNDGNWADCSGNPPTGGMQNQAESIYNDGVPSGPTAVNIYYDRWQSGAYRCLPLGQGWEDLTTGGQTFDHWGNNGHGLNQLVNNNAASHKWVYSC